jgi:hypothetical protein
VGSVQRHVHLPVGATAERYEILVGASSAHFYENTPATFFTTKPFHVLFCDRNHRFWSTGVISSQTRSNIPGKPQQKLGIVLLLARPALVDGGA